MKGHCERHGWIECTWIHSNYGLLILWNIFEMHIQSVSPASPSPTEFHNFSHCGIDGYVYPLWHNTSKWWTDITLCTLSQLFFQLFIVRLNWMRLSILLTWISSIWCLIVSQSEPTWPTSTNFSSISWSQTIVFWQQQETQINHNNTKHSNTTNMMNVEEQCKEKHKTQDETTPS